MGEKAVGLHSKKDDYSTNIRLGDCRRIVAIRHLVNNIRTWYKFHFRFPWVRYSGFVRVMHGVVFVQGMNASLGNNVQFGPYCLITTHIRVR